MLTPPRLPQPDQHRFCPRWSREDRHVLPLAELMHGRSFLMVSGVDLSKPAPLFSSVLANEVCPYRSFTSSGLLGALASMQELRRRYLSRCVCQIPLPRAAAVPVLKPHKQSYHKCFQGIHLGLLPNNT